MMNANPAALIHQNIQIRGDEFEVVGILSEKGSQGSFQNPDEQILVPLSTARYRLFGTGLRVGHFLPATVSLYLILIVYQATLWARLEGTEGPIPPRTSVSRKASAGQVGPVASHAQGRKSRP